MSPKPDRSRTRRAIAAMAAMAIAFGIFGATPPAGAAPGDEIHIPDDALRRCLNDLLGQDAGDPVTEAQAGSLGWLSCEDRGVTDLTGLEHMTTLKTLLLMENRISDLTPLSALPALEVLLLDRNEISDVGPIATIPLLGQVGLADNRIEDLSPLAEATELYSLGLARNRISDLTPLAGLDLSSLGVAGNSVTDLSPVGHVDQVYAFDQQVDLGSVAAGVPITNPVVDREGDPVALSDLHDPETNTFTPVEGGPTEVEWGDHAGVVMLRSTDGSGSAAADPWFYGTIRFSPTLVLDEEGEDGEGGEEAADPRDEGAAGDPSGDGARASTAADTAARGAELPRTGIGSRLAMVAGAFALLSAGAAVTFGGRRSADRRS